MFLEVCIVSAGLHVTTELYKKVRKKMRAKALQGEQTVAGTENQQRIESIVTVNRDIVISLTSLGLATVGALGYALLSWFSLPGVLYVTLPIFKESVSNLKKGKVNMYTLISIVLGGCILSGEIWVANITLAFVILARKLVAVISEDVHKNLIDVFKQHPDSVWVLAEGTEVAVPFDSIQAGDTVIVQAGEMIPADGTIIEGIASIDQHILTGESQPVEKESGDHVFASTVIISGRILFHVEHAGDETTVANIGHILNETIDFKSTIQLRSETLTNKTVLPALILGAASFPLLGANGALALVNTHFKSRMLLTAPISILNYFNIASRQGVLIKDGRSLDLLHQVDTVVFDKTGTLTEEYPHVGEIYSFCDEYDLNEILVYAAAAEAKQTHPIAKAIQQKASQQQVTPPVIDDAQYHVGYGLSVEIEQTRLRVGSLRFMEREDLAISPKVRQMQEACHQQGHIIVFVARDRQIIGGIELVQALRPEVKTVIRRLRECPQITSLYIISGDHDAPTRTLAVDLGIDHYFAGVLPQHKAEIIEQLQREGKVICYIGDGINDAIALRKAQVSVSLRGASTVATDTAHIVLLDGTLHQLNTLFDLGQDFHSNMNLMFAVTLIPMFIGIGGIFFLNFGLLSTVIINKLGLLGSLTVAMTPVLKERSSHFVTHTLGQSIDQLPSRHMFRKRQLGY